MEDAHQRPCRPAFRREKKSRKEVKATLFLFPTREDGWVRSQDPKGGAPRPLSSFHQPGNPRLSPRPRAPPHKKKKVLDERERPGTRMHACMHGGSFLLSAFAPTRRYHHIYVLTVVAYRRLQFKQCRTSSIRGHPSHVRTYSIYWCAAAKRNTN